MQMYYYVFTFFWDVCDSVSASEPLMACEQQFAARTLIQHVNS